MGNPVYYLVPSFKFLLLVSLYLTFIKVNPVLSKLVCLNSSVK